MKKETVDAFDAYMGMLTDGMIQEMMNSIYEGAGLAEKKIDPNARIKFEVLDKLYGEKDGLETKDS